MENIINFIKPELIVVALVLYILGMALKEVQAFSDKKIPLALGAAGIVLAVIYVFATTEVASVQDGFMCLFTAITQGILCAGVSVYANQIVIQSKKEN